MKGFRADVSGGAGLVGSLRAVAVRLGFLFV